MIDWWAVLSHSLWLAGLATVLATFSTVDWQGDAPPGAVAVRARLRSIAAKWIAFAQSRSFAVGIALFCLGLGMTTYPSWQRVLWLGLAAAAGALAAWPRPAGPQEPAP